MARLPVCECESVHQDIVDAVKPQLLGDAEAIDLASVFKLFGDGTRVRIFRRFACTSCACVIWRVFWGSPSPRSRIS